MNFGLKPTPHDPRDYSYHKTFGSAIVALPDEYFVARPNVLDQGPSQFCTAYSTSVVATCMDGVEFNPDWFFAKEKENSGGDLDEGEDLRVAAKTASNFGFLPSSPSQPSLATESPHFLANYFNWPQGYDDAAKPYKKQSYFRVDGDFKSVLNTLYQNKDFKRAILTGVTWQNEWTVAQGGVIEDGPSSDAGLHAVALIGFTTKNGKKYIVLQNSYGKAYGDSGLFYFSEAVFNKFFVEPMFMFVDMPDGVATSSVPTIGSRWEVLLYIIIKFFKTYVDAMAGH